MYDEYNFDAKNYLLKELNKIFYKKYDDKNLLKRCYKELNLLYENDVLFITEYLYKFKKEKKDVSYYFNGMVNNLFVLYVLGLNVVNPIKYERLIVEMRNLYNAKHTLLKKLFSEDKYE